MQEALQKIPGGSGETIKDLSGMADPNNNEYQKKIRLPFIVVCVSDNPLNTIYCDSHPKYLKISSLEKMRCFGDGNVLDLMKFG